MWMVDFQFWEAMDEHLCQLAKQFKATHGGRKMEVAIFVYRRSRSDDTSPLAAWLMSGLAMPKLREEVDVEIREYTLVADSRGFAVMTLQRLSFR
jgi:hypothetical protein